MKSVEFTVCDLCELCCCVESLYIYHFWEHIFFLFPAHFQRETYSIVWTDSSWLDALLYTDVLH